MSQISIIIPVYNAGDNLYKLNDSLTNQTYQDIEIIYINDGSSDNSLEILNSFAKLDNRVQVIDQVNQGGCAARNTGLNAAQGEFLFFCDADDYIELNTIEKLYRAAQEQSADIVVCNYRDVLPTGEIVRENIKASNFEGNNLKVNPEILFLKPAVWNKLFRRTLFTDNKIKFEETRIAQDLSTTLRLFTVANSISGIPEVLYNYVLHENTVSRSYDTRILDIIKSVNIIKEFYIKNGIYDTYKYELEFIAIQNILYQMTKIPMMKNHKHETYNQFVNYLNGFSTLKENKYLKRSKLYTLLLILFKKNWFFNNIVIQKSIKFVNNSSFVYKVLRKLD